jgi:septum formation topological specificity factor MinE
MPNHQVTIKVEEKEILELVQKHLGIDFQKIRWDIEETGDHDRGTYRRRVKYLEITSESVPSNSSYK